MLTRAKTSHDREQGVALIMVLWMIVVMMSLSATLLYAVKTETHMVTYARQTAQARAFADAATHYTVMQLFLPTDQRTIRLGGTPSTWTYGDYEADIRVVGENGLIDINRADRELLRKVLEAVGIVDEAAESLLDRIEDFRDADDLKRLNGAEDADYEAAGLKYGAKDAGLQRIEELQQVIDLDQSTYQALSRYLSVHSFSSGLNPLVAPRRILMILADNDAALVDDYMRLREEAEGAWVQPPFGNQFIDTTQSPVFRMQFTIKPVNGEQRYFEERAVRLLPGRKPPFITYFRSQQSSSRQF